MRDQPTKHELIEQVLYSKVTLNYTISKTLLAAVEQ